ncbi:hypothetical protein [Mucilaginibacter sp.]|uniref:hypothetical protein n=1 Tax=Mucilaginibacter sp. TaxID=1882438 RepID=UPI00284BC43E|nr:hypothetical protein [Mucilaginibacter sp.]MDR3693957.1 hypothetical protein [Mucilaginibacter sp.]
MKNTILYFLISILLFAYGCSANKSNNPTPTTLAPVGTFSGHFEVIHHKSITIDSASANITLDMQAATGFKVTGDTSTVHEGSYGGFIVYQANNTIYFQDHDTYQAAGAAAKVHLNGLYSYSYDGTTLQIGYRSYLDTLILKYNLKKAN